MYHMKHQKSLTSGLPYVRLITKILEGYGIDLKREPKKKMFAREYEINASTSVRNIGIFSDKDEPSNASPLAPEGGYTNEVLYNKICSVESTMIRNYHEQKFEMTSIKRLLENLTKSQNLEISDEE